jgi:class 3 adenylate cyclase/tetratricopeptide (TPR) repeat protein
VCSVLFCDLVGFTHLSTSRDPEEARELLSRYFDAARTVIGRYGGTVEKFIGDAVMAVWGAPIAAEGDAERAVRAALDVVAAVAALGETVGASGLAARAGVVTGEVAVTLGATGQGMVAGDAVNTASRVQAAASSGGVLVDEATRRLTATAISFEDAGEHALKGKAEAERLWRATRILSGRGGAQRVDGLEAPLTGRDAELRTVKELFHAAAERRVPRLVVVSGPAGVGKSRLGWEFEKYIDGLAATVLWHRGRCLSYGEGVAFWALAEIVRQRFGIADDDRVESAAVKLSEGVERYVPDPVERAYVALRLGRLLGVPVSGDNGAGLAREELFAGWRLFVERLAAEKAVVLLVEDAQHADSGLLDFIDHLVDWARELPIFVLVFGRPELERGRPGFGTGRNRTTLTLDPLDGTSMDGLVHALVPGLPRPARAAITAHAQGIPLFAVETVRSLIDREVVVSSNGEYRLVGDVGALAVPDSLHGLLASRLDALEPAVRALVADAAVLGSTFPAEALIAISNQPEAMVRASMAELLRREVFEVSADPLSPQRGTYGFAQSMLRQVAYDTLSRHDRKARHLAVAEYLRTTFPEDGEEIIDVVARHYLDAVEAVPDDPDADELRGKAAAALVRAGERAQRAGGATRAAASFAAAAGLVERAPPTDENADVLAAARLWERAALADVLAADHVIAAERAERARRLYLEHGEVRAGARAQALAGRALRRAGRHTEAREQIGQALAVLRPEPDADTVSALNDLASLEVFSGGADADRLTAEVLDLGQALDVEPGLLADLFVNRGVEHGVCNRPAQAIASLEYATRLAERAGDTSRWARALLNLSDLLARTDVAAAGEAARAAAGHARRVGDREILAVALVNEAGVLLLTGDWDQAQAVLSHGAEAEGLSDQSYLLCLGGLLDALRGAVTPSAAVQAAVTKLSVSEDQQDQAEASLIEAFTAVAGGRQAAALEHARLVVGHMDAMGVGAEQIRWGWPLAVRVAHEVGDLDGEREMVALLDTHPRGHLPPLLQAERKLARARLTAVADADQGAAALTAAVVAARQVGSRYHLAHALLDQAAHLWNIGDGVAAGAAADEAGAIAAQLRAGPLLRRAEKISAVRTAVSA